MRNTVHNLIWYHPLALKLWQTNLLRKQLRYHRNPERQHEHDVGDPDLVRVGEVVRLASNLVHMEAQREDDGGQTEQNH